MSTTISEMFSGVREATHETKLIAWDGCHKIYLAMDETEANYMVSHGGYECVVGTPEEMFDKLVEWYEASCGLKFISKVETVGQDSEFTHLVPQGAEDSDPYSDEDDEDSEVENYYGDEA